MPYINKKMYEVQNKHILENILDVIMGHARGRT